MDEVLVIASYPGLRILPFRCGACCDEETLLVENMIQNCPHAGADDPGPPCSLQETTGIEVQCNTQST